ncbi:ubiquitin-conjugating enzyme E2 Ze, partial [Halocaridina rubra]
PKLRKTEGDRRGLGLTTSSQATTGASVLPSATASSSVSSMSFIPEELTPSVQSVLADTASKVKHYDPLISPDWDAAGPPGILCSHRVKRDLKCIFSDPLPGIFVVPEEENLFRVHCLIIGPFDTPYEGGLFHFLVRFGPQYPLHPPRVRFLTTGGGAVRFNPNLYSNGKVCLSILGTWSGPAWSPASNLSSLLLSLQSLMNENPYHNEPGYEKERKPGDCDKYNTIITHETIRVAVLQQLQGITIAPPEVVRVMRASFMEYYDHYVEICEKNLYRDGTDMEDPFRDRRGKFQYGVLLKNLEKLKEEIEASGTPTLPDSFRAPEPTRSTEMADDGEASSTSSSEVHEGATLMLSEDEAEDTAQANGNE